MQVEFFNSIGPTSETTETSETFQQCNQSGLFPEASHANQQVLPGSGEARQMTAGSGRRLLPWLTAFGPHGCCLKTLLESCLLTADWNSNTSALRWKIKGTRFNRLVFQLVPLGHSSIESGSGYAPTPNARDYRDISRTTAHLAARGRHTPSLTTECLIRGMRWQDIAEAYAAVMGYPSLWCAERLKDTETPLSQRSPINSSSE